MQVFISYANRDKDLARGLAKVVRDAGMTVWLEDSILPGDNWALELGKALEESEVMLLLFTHDNQHSATLRQEVQFALTNGKYRGRVLPILVNMQTFQAGEDIPWVLKRFEQVHVDGYPPDFSPVAEHLEKLVRA